MDTKLLDRLLALFNRGDKKLRLEMEEAKLEERTARLENIKRETRVVMRRVH